MSRGLSWRQRWMLDSIAYEAVARRSEEDHDLPVAWRSISYGPTDSESDPNFSSSARIQWNIEQATRRALRSLERRGLVELDRYCFTPNADMDIGSPLASPQIVWRYTDPDDYVPGETRTMTGVHLTKAGWGLVTERSYLGLRPA